MLIVVVTVRRVNWTPFHKIQWGESIESQDTILCKSNKKGKRKVQGMPQSQTAALPRHQEEEETDKTKQAQIEQTY